MRLTLYALLLLAVGSCAKDDADQLTKQDKGCIERLAFEADAHGLVPATYAKAARLFGQNGISLTNLRLTNWQEEDITLNGVASHYVHVTGTPFDKGLPFLRETVRYHFRDNSYYFMSGARPTADVSPAPALELPIVRALFFEAFKQNNQQPSARRPEDFRKTCLTAELGYYTFGVSGAPTSLVRAWHVVPKGERYPEAYINDQDGTVLYFFDGVFF